MQVDAAVVRLLLLPLQLLLLLLLLCNTEGLVLHRSLWWQRGRDLSMASSGKGFEKPHEVEISLATGADTPSEEEDLTGSLSSI